MTREIYNSDFIDYEIVDGECSYCGKDAEYGEDSFGKIYFYCQGCDSYNIDLEMGIDDDENNVNYYDAPPDESF